MKGPKVGRNDPCSCGSGKKYKKCCERHPQQASSIRAVPLPASQRFTMHKLSREQVPPDVLKHAASRFPEQLLNPGRALRYGQVRPEIAMDFHGYRFVAIGSKMIYMPADRCKFFTDVLIAYVPQLFGRDWFNQEIAKPRDERHPAMQWRVKGMTFMNAQPKLADGSYGAFPTGPLLAYLTLAYDLYIVDHNGRLDARLLSRLKHKDQFQGARHELFAEATCLRAGFQIEHENEADPSSRHAEFTAIHKATGLKVSVEAKSKHRPGVLGRAGVREPEDNLNLRFGGLLNDAVAKNAPHPLVVFMDVNMPFQAGYRLLSQRPPDPLICQVLDRMRKVHGGKDPINLLLVTNHAQHYTSDEELAQKPAWFTSISEVPLKPVRAEVLWELARAANLYGNIPVELPVTVSDTKTVVKEKQRAAGRG
jgi:hypothetical protein